MKHKSRLDLLMVAIHRWLEMPKVSRSIIAAEVVASVDALGLAGALAKEGISFNCTSDSYNDARVNAQKIFRWLGQYQENHAMPERLFHVEQVILAAMPQQLKLNYLNAVYAMVGVTVVADHGLSSAEINTATLAISLTKENAEAQVAVIQLGDAPNREAVIAAHRELSESRGTTQAAMDLLEKHFPFVGHKASLKAVEGNHV
ncbi:hypothetical protein HNW13_000075 [Shewanella sp. BF02_Schw]|uniref:hypothetical protein n=1 Tax=Shewanella sp. BF02_Schw TaxID=394908 RepID=UPI001785099F|nr:hypothetical protein [Shewanella sp. BF02_Schw]MBO1894201.1 hypothetical protein [Shewanella sp. BF02_Schw]